MRNRNSLVYNNISVVVLILIFYNMTPLAANAGRHYFVSNYGNDNNSGVLHDPFLNIDYALGKLTAGDTLFIMNGKYKINNSIIISLKGKKNKWVVIRGQSNDKTIIDAEGAHINWDREYPGVRGSIQIEYASYVRLENLRIVNNHLSGINIKESDHIDIINCTVENSFASGISAWQKCENIRILGNFVINANNRKFFIGTFRGKEEPHEAISIAGPHNFEIAYNEVAECKKEGIDIKETSANGQVHHNYIHDCGRQGLYVDAWFGVLDNIEFYNNVVTRCEEGFAVSNENGTLTKNIKFHHNLLFKNRGVGIFFSRWGHDYLRKKIFIYNNTVYHNGYEKPHNGYNYFWLCGGLYIFSTHLDSIVITKNIFADNYPFEIGLSSDYKNNDLEKKHIFINDNLIYDKNNVEYPVYLAEWAKDSVYSVYGDSVRLLNPHFIDPQNDNFKISPKKEEYRSYGAFGNLSAKDHNWWERDFPPKINIKNNTIEKIAE